MPDVPDRGSNPVLAALEVPEWVDAAREDPNGLAALIAGRNLEIHRQIMKTYETRKHLKGMDAVVRADLGGRTLTSTSAAALRTAQVPMAELNAAIQQAIRAGRWSLGGAGSALQARSSELDQAFSETVAGWQRALAAIDASFEDLVRQSQQEAFDDYRPYADLMRPGKESLLAPFVFPQDAYIGAELAADPAYAHKRRVFPRWLMRRRTLPDRSWADLPWIDLCDTNLVFLPDNSNLSYAQVTAAARGIVTDQMSRSAPNRLKVLWIDALHNGQSAGGFLHLAESGSHIIDTRVWTDPASIESALLRVVDRMAVLERTCLKNEFENLDAYNAQPGVAQEAHQTVVVAGYPAGFGLSSANLLKQISENGARVGICVIVIMDTQMAPIIGMTDEVAPTYAQLTDGPGAVNVPAWWSLALLPLGEFVVGHSGQPYARVTTIPQNESTWVPCELRSVDDTVQASIIRGYAHASRQLAQSGLSPRELEIKLKDPAARTTSLRVAMIGWLHEQEAANQLPPDWDGLVRSEALERAGLGYTLAEITKQASYLHDQGYIVAGSHSPDTTGMSFPRLTSKGEDMAMSDSPSADDFAANSGRSSTGATYNYNGPVFHGDVNGAQISWNNRNVTQSQNRLEQVAPGFESLAEAVTRTLAQLPQFGLAAEDAEDASASADEILLEVVSPAPDRGKIRRSLAALRGFITPVANQAALGAGEGSHALAKAALDHLQSIVF